MTFESAINNLYWTLTFLFLYVCVCVSYVVNSFILDSMLRCLMHILVRAEPISLVAPGKQQGVAV